MYPALVAQALAALLLIWAAVHDARNFRVPNTTVLAMLVLYLPAQGLLGFPTWQNDLAGGVLLFVMGFAMWAVRLLGAGDAKLMLPLGMLLSLGGLGPFAVLLIFFSGCLYCAILVSHAMGLKGGIGGWLGKMKSEGKVPYAVPMALAAVPVLALKAIYTFDQFAGMRFAAG